MQMRAIQISHAGGPGVLCLCERAMPEPKPGEVRIRVLASGVNRPDVLQRTGAYPPPADASDLPGLEVAGVIDAGDAATLVAHHLHLGQAVCALTNGGGYAEWVCTPAGQVLPQPVGWNAVQAAALPETFFTVWSNVFMRGRLQPGETLLVHGGGSGIGVAAIQLAKAFGARVIATVGSDARAHAVAALGADAVINYKSQDFVAETLAVTDGRGADVVLDMVAGSYVQRNTQCMAIDGRLVIIAVQGGVEAGFNAGQLMRKRLSIGGSTLRPQSALAKAAIAQQLLVHAWPRLARAPDATGIRPVIHATFPALKDGAVLAHELMESGEHIGKIVLDWSSQEGS